MTFRSSLLWLAALGGLAGSMSSSLVGCSSALDSSDGTSATVPANGGLGEPNDASVSSDASGPSAVSADSSDGGVSLCGSLDSCEPDSVTACDQVDASVPTPLDGGPRQDGHYDEDAGAVVVGMGLACRVKAAPDGARSSTCRAAGMLGDGEACRASSDCSAGFECVDNPGQCRRYCCLGGTSCAGDRICDKQAIVDDSNTLVPVCVPIRPCKLLTANTCPDNQTCGIADQTDGRTSCLAIGSATAGNDCETANCAAGLTCLGEQGHRKCFTLCSKMSTTDCPSNMHCKGTTPLFQEADEGVCMTDVAGL